MDKKIKKQWIKALRSGEYEQCAGRLCTEQLGKTTFCALGVLCDLAVKAGVIDKPQLLDGFDDFEAMYSYGKKLHVTVLPPEVVEWADTNCYSPSVNEGTIMDLNDEGMSFTELAELIENQL